MTAEQLAWDDGRSGDQILHDPSRGCSDLWQRVVRLGPGERWTREPADGDDVLFVLAGHGRLHVGEATGLGLEPETAAHVTLGAGYAVDCDGEELVVLVVWAPGAAEPGSGPGAVLRLGDQEDQAATADRQFRLLAGPDSGCASVTQFVGEIPPGRAPDHYHHYDEVIYVLEGEGVLHLGDRHDPVGPGAAIHLRSEQVHSLENSGPGGMRVLGVFRPAGSPSEAYYPDGTRATSTS
jgi:quercetin dioxygenase-like cupin family protein